ncbi:MAG: Peptidyl-prolyl cis-trans isomerase [Verrucomicrobiota bacterium]
MIGSIRKHSKWLWWVIAGLTIISFVVFMGSGPSKNSRGGREAGYGTIYGHEIKGDEVAQAKSDYFIYFLISNGEWPDKNRNVTTLQIEQQIYLNLLLTQKAKSLGIAVPDEAVTDAASQMLRAPALTRALGTSGQPVPMDKFVENILKPKGLTAVDFQSAVRSQLTIEQLRMALGLSGSLVTPQEAGALYDRERSEVSASAVFFSVSNHLAQVSTTPAEVGQFFTNNMAYYRLPERLQVNYVWFNVTNFLAASKAEWAKTNLEVTVDNVYRQYGTTEFKAATAEESKAKIREFLIQRRALNLAAEQATEFVKVLWATEPVKPENILALAKAKNLNVKTSLPFSAEGSIAEFANAPAVEREAVKLNAESPFTGAIAGEDGIYVAGIANQLPSSIPSLAEIGGRVALDLRGQQAHALATKAGTNFYFNTAVQIAAGKTFAQAAVSAGQTPVLLSPFSLSSSEVPEAGDRVDIRALKQVAFATPVGGLSRFMPTQDGGFVLHVEKISPADPAKKALEMPAVLSQIRRGRENEAFNIWVNTEASREFQNIAAFQKLQAAAASQP